MKGGKVFVDNLLCFFFLICFLQVMMGDDVVMVISYFQDAWHYFVFNNS